MLSPNDPFRQIFILQTSPTAPPLSLSTAPTVQLMQLGAAGVSVVGPVTPSGGPDLWVLEATIPAGAPVGERFYFQITGNTDDGEAYFALSCGVTVGRDRLILTEVRNQVSLCCP